MENDSLQEEPLNEDSSESEEICIKRTRLPRRLATVQSNKELCAKDERNASIKKVSLILQKLESDRTDEDNQMLTEYHDAVEQVRERWRRRDEAKRRLEEFEDSEDVLNTSCQVLAQAIAQSQHLVVYTGAGISTAAKIPDYRGPNGIWTRLQQGKDIGNHDLSLAEPTYTHMALAELYKKNILKYVVSQNCDGLHLRSGLPKTALSELHGNMYVEVCKTCKPHKEYWRLFDVTEYTARYYHKTQRKCYTCNEPLEDTIVHFGERGRLQWPLNWSGACKNARKATTILCLGSSLKVLKKYPWLWQMDKPVKKRANLYIVNLQWTPKDDFANVKINGKCDDVMRKVMDLLGLSVPKYTKSMDPIYAHCTPLHDLESHTTTQPLLKAEADELKPLLALKVEKEDNTVPFLNSDDKEKPPLVQNYSFKKDCNTESHSDLTRKMISHNCDTSVKKCLPATNKSNSLSHSFSIDSLLQRDPKPLIQDTKPNYFVNPTLSMLSYNLLDVYTGFFLYPYQTSFLYSGLHSIINPMPMYDENDVILHPKKEVVKIEPECTFCFENLGNNSCLFYSRFEPIFTEQKFRFSKIEQKEKPNICVCCDYTTEEEDVDNSNVNESNNRDQNKSKIQAGWFGKGYKKGKRRRKGI